MSANVSILTYHGETLFTDEALKCANFSSMNASENDNNTHEAAGTEDVDGWLLDFTQKKDGYKQISTAAPEAKQTVKCTTVSSRTNADKNHSYKLGDSVKMRSGYKIRASASEP